MKNIKDAVKIFKSEKCKFILMHCVSTYPCEKFKFKYDKNTKR